MKPLFVILCILTIVNGANYIQFNVFNTGNEYEFSAPENSGKGGESLGVVTCTGPEGDVLNGSVAYSILNSDSVPFTLNSMNGKNNTGNSSGVLILKNGQVLDYEQSKLYCFNISCSYNSDPSINAMAIVRFSVLPVNEFLPVLSDRSLIVTINELSPSGTILVSRDSFGLKNYTVSDADQGSDGEVQFLSRDNNPAGFELDEMTGALRLMQALDLDSGNLGLLRLTYSFLVCDGDRPHTECNSVDVFIFVLSANDNPPMFEQDEYNVTIPETTLVGTSLITVVCTDADRHSVGELSGITVEPPDAPVFIPNGSNGTVVLRYIGRSSSIIVNLVCRDTGSLQSSATLYIAILRNEIPSEMTSEISKCPSGPDSTWGIVWPETESNSTSTQTCPGQMESTTVTGNAARYCSSGGMWSEPDVLGCKNKEFMGILDQATDIFSQLLNSTIPVAQLVEQTKELTAQLVNLTEPTTTSLLPSSLSATSEVLTGVITVLEEAQNNSMEIIEVVANVLNNVLDKNNSKGWIALQSSSSSHGSQVLLDSAERLGKLLAQTQNSTNSSSEPVRVSKNNIAMSAKQFDINKNVTMESLKFPQKEDLVNFDNTVSASVSPAKIQIPVQFMRERLNQTNTTAIPIVFIIFHNLATFLPSPTDDSGNITRKESVVISSQVGARGYTGPSPVLFKYPISLNFSFEIDTKKVQRYQCVFWNFSQPVGSGGWISDGVETVGNTTTGSLTTVECTSTHLTSFAVLVDVAGGLQDDLNPVETEALKVVSYIGCVISIICLIISIIFFITQGKKLRSQVNSFIHLNLALSLLLGYLVFVLGIETAKGSIVGCAFVAALLHYLFLAVFCWMLCEGVMLYLMLVVVFSRLAKAWWFFLILGYLPPILFVAITLIVRWEHYGVKDKDGNLQFCWLSTKYGTIFGFVAPMLLIVLINLVFMGFALKTLWRSKKDTKKIVQGDNYSLQLIKSLMLAVVVLQPLLGLTWVFGLLTINSNTTVFAWIFTILNSLQGVAFFFFHVIRSDKVRDKIRKLYKTYFRGFSTNKHLSQGDTKQSGSKTGQATEMGILKSTRSDITKDSSSFS